MIKKASGILILFCLALLSFSGDTSADSPYYDIVIVKVNGFDIGGSQLDVERDDVLNIQVWLEGKMNETSSPSIIPDVRIEAKILGYEFGSVSDISEIFSVEEDFLYKKSLTLRIPHDIDASEKYTLRIEVSDPRDDEERAYTLNIDEQRHQLNIFDIVINPSTTIQAGQPLFPSIILENLGEFKQENIRVAVSVPELGISSVNYVDELITQLEEERRTFNLEEESSERVDFILRIPEDAPSKEYTLQVDVLYNRGHSTITATRKFFVQGIEKAKEVETMINIDSTSKKVKQGEEIAYKLMFANLGTEKGIYSIQVEGVPWGQYRVEPAFVNVAPDSTAEAFIYIKPNDNTEAKNYVSVVRVLLGSKQIVNEFNLYTEVTAQEDIASPTSALKIILAIVFIVLVIVLIILALIIAFRKVREPETEEPAVGAPEGQTYYYNPRR